MGEPFIEKDSAKEFTYEGILQHMSAEHTGRWTVLHLTVYVKDSPTVTLNMNKAKVVLSEW